MTLRFVHLSDIHFGQERDGSAPTHEDVRAEILTDCERLRTEGHIAGAATGILLTGDISYGGKEVEFKQAADWIDALTTRVGCDRRAVQMIPGNHDVDLDSLDATNRMVQETLRAKSVAEIQGYLNSVADQEVHPLLGKLADYRSFAGAYGSDFKSPAQPITIKEHSLPGGKLIRMIGLCSVLISDKSDRRGSMFLGQNQYVVQRNPEFEDFYLIHHPLDWLKDEHDAARYINGRARVLITGHEHYPSLSVIHREDGFQQVVLAAGAANPPGAAGDFVYTYNWLEFDWLVENGKAVLSISVFPRRWNSRSTCFETDYSRTKGSISTNLRLDCGPYQDAKLKASSAKPASVPEVEAQDLATAKINTMPPSNPVPEGVADHSSYELLRFLFWKYLDRSTRQTVLVELGLLRASEKPLPNSFERDAFKKASQEGKLHDLWEHTMKFTPDAERRDNPF